MRGAGANDIREGQALRPIPSSLQLPFHFDVERLLTDLATAEAFSWPAHYNTKDYRGSWTSISLRSANGQLDNVFAHPTDDFRDTPLLAQCPYIQWVLSQFHCDKMSVRLLRLDAGSEVLTHRDIGLSYAEGEFRVHIPILTNDAVEFIVDGMEIPMRAGECWYADFTRHHSVANRGETPRVHLVIDCVRNQWTDELLQSLGFDVETKAEIVRTPDELRSMIATYRSSGHPALIEQADLLQSQMGGRH